MRDNTTDVFFALLRVGLWEGENLNHDLDIDGTTDWGEVYRLAKQQSVVGLIAAGVEIQSRKTKRIPHEMALKMARGMLKLEQRNIAMNRLIADLVNKMRVADIETLLVKGQGIVHPVIAGVKLLQEREPAQVMDHADVQQAVRAVGVRRELEAASLVFMVSADREARPPE
jgi:hypothetical protein